MSKRVLFVGLDVDDNAFHAYLICPQSGEYFQFKCKSNVGNLHKQLNKYIEKGFELKICYESTYIGFSLCRDLLKKGYCCKVIASSLIPDSPGKKQKTDRLDCKKLAEYYMKDLLTPVYLPNEEDEAVRDIVRSRNFLKSQVKNLKSHILSLCRRAGINYRQETNSPQASHWTQMHTTWLERKVNKLTINPLKSNFNILLTQLQQVEIQIEQYNNEIFNLSNSDNYEDKVKALVCFRGIDVLTAMVFITELGDVNRFPHPSKLASYVGFDIIEYSSGGRDGKSKISKMGNSFLRTACVESSQFSMKPPRISRKLKIRRQGANAKSVEIADKCMNRLYKKGTTLKYKNKPHNKIKVACGRELLNFVWESLKEVA